MCSVDRLALVSKVLLDQRFLELKRENERLTLMLFWVDHGEGTLRKLMYYANNKSGGPRCRCRYCAWSERYRPMYSHGHEEYNKECRFVPWFEKTLQEHGLSFASSGKDSHFARDADRESGTMPGGGVHFLLGPNEQAPVTSWYKWEYGAKLRDAQTTQDPGLLNLTALFQTLGGEPDWLLADPDDSDSESW
jgi:hypothetical protein